MKYVVCYKLVPNESSIGVMPDKSLDLANCEWEIGQYDLRAVEIAARLAEASPENRLIALTAGNAVVENSKLKKSILARGPHELLAVEGDVLSRADSFATAQVLAEAIRGLGEVDAVFFGEGSGDLYSQQVGNITGALLGWNTVNAVSSVQLDGDCLLVERSLEECTEVLRVSLPAAVSVTSDSCLPRLASMKEILKRVHPQRRARRCDRHNLCGADGQRLPRRRRRLRNERHHRGSRRRHLDVRRQGQPSGHLPGRGHHGYIEQHHEPLRCQLLLADRAHRTDTRRGHPGQEGLRPRWTA